MRTKVGVVGLGYVGLTLTAALADKGFTVYGADVSPAVRRTRCRRAGRTSSSRASRRSSPTRIGTRIHVGTELPKDTVDVAVISVSTPVDEITHRPNLANLAAAARGVAASCRPDTLVVVRSTVPVGTSRRVVLPELRAAWGDARPAGDGARADHPGPGAARTRRAAAGDRRSGRGEPGRPGSSSSTGWRRPSCRCPSWRPPSW